MAVTHEEIQALIDRIGEQQENFPQSQRGEECWWDDLSDDVKAQATSMNWPASIVAGGREGLENWAAMIGQL